MGSYAPTFSLLEHVVIGKDVMFRLPVLTEEVSFERNTVSVIYIPS